MRTLMRGLLFCIFFSSPNVALAGMATIPHYLESGKKMVYYTLERGNVRQSLCNKREIISPDDCGRDQKGNLDPKAVKELNKEDFEKELKTRIADIFESGEQFKTSEETYRKAQKALEAVKKVAPQNKLEERLKKSQMEKLEALMDRTVTRESAFDGVMASITTNPHLIQHAFQGDKWTQTVDRIFQLIPAKDGAAYCERSRLAPKVRLLSMLTPEGHVEEHKNRCRDLGSFPLEFDNITDPQETDQKEQTPITCRKFARSPVGEKIPIVRSGVFDGKKVIWDRYTLFGQEVSYGNDKQAAIIFDPEGSECTLKPLANGWNLPGVCISDWQPIPKDKETYCASHFEIF